MGHMLLGALTWEPQIKGAVIVLIATLVLPGSALLLLGTNTGLRLGFLLAATGLMGWMTVMGLTWTVYGIGLKGRAPEWKVQTVVQGDVGRSRAVALDRFPRGWKSIKLEDPEVAEAQAVADAVLAPPPDAGKKGVYSSSSDYVPAAGYDRGGEKYLFTLKHRPHWLALQVQRVVKQETVLGQPPPKAKADPSQPVTTVLMIRDLGSLRVPPAEVTFFSFVLFALLVNTLHRRDKDAMAAGAAARPGAGAKAGAGR